MRLQPGYYYYYYFVWSKMINLLFALVFLLWCQNWQASIPNIAFTIAETFSQFMI